MGSFGTFFNPFLQDLRGEIKKVACFLNKSLTEEQVEKIADHLRFENFEKNEMVNNEAGRKMGFMNPDGKFIRKGSTEINKENIMSKPNLIASPNRNNGRLEKSFQPGIQHPFRQLDRRKPGGNRFKVCDRA